MDTNGHHQRILLEPIDIIDRDLDGSMDQGAICFDDLLVKDGDFPNQGIRNYCFWIG